MFYILTCFDVLLFRMTMKNKHQNLHFDSYFFAHMNVNVAAFLEFFIWIYSSVTFISGPLSYYN